MRPLHTFRYIGFVGLLVGAGCLGGGGDDGSGGGDDGGGDDTACEVGYGVHGAAPDGTLEVCVARGATPVAGVAVYAQAGDALLSATSNSQGRALFTDDALTGAVTVGVVEPNRGGRYAQYWRVASDHVQVQLAVNGDGIEAGTVTGSVPDFDAADVVSASVETAYATTYVNQPSSDDLTAQCERADGATCDFAIAAGAGPQLVFATVERDGAPPRYLASTVDVVAGDRTAVALADVTTTDVTFPRPALPTGFTAGADLSVGAFVDVGELELDVEELAGGGEGAATLPLPATGGPLAAVVRTPLMSYSESNDDGTSYQWTAAYAAPGADFAAAPTLLPAITTSYDGALHTSALAGGTARYATILDGAGNSLSVFDLVDAGTGAALALPALPGGPTPATTAELFYVTVTDEVVDPTAFAVGTSATLPRATQALVFAPSSLRAAQPPTQPNTAKSISKHTGSSLPARPHHAW